MLERGADDGDLLDVGRQWNRPGDVGARSLRRFDDLLGGLIEDAVVVGLQANADPLLWNRLGPRRLHHPAACDAVGDLCRYVLVVVELHAIGGASL